MELYEHRREMYNGFGDTLARAFELVLTPVVLGLIGFGFDRAFGITPVLTVVFVVLAIVGLAVKMYYGYKAEMDAAVDRLPSRSGRG